MTKHTLWEQHEIGGWELLKDALERDWEQTKADLSGRIAGHELHQGATDTLSQAVGTRGIPAIDVPNCHADEVEKAGGDDAPFEITVVDEGRQRPTRS